MFLGDIWCVVPVNRNNCSRGCWWCRSSNQTFLCAQVQNGRRPDLTAGTGRLCSLRCRSHPLDTRALTYKWTGGLLLANPAALMPTNDEGALIRAHFQCRLGFKCMRKNKACLNQHVLISSHYMTLGSCPFVMEGKLATGRKTCFHWNWRSSL